MQPHLLPKISQLIAFERVVQLGSINAAADEMGHSQSSVSRQIKELESVLHVRLLERKSTGTFLTPEGQRFAQYTSLALHELNQGTLEVGGSEISGVASVRIGITSISARSILPWAFNACQREFPNTIFHFETSPLEVTLDLLKSGKLDFAIGNAATNRSFADFTRDPLFTCPFYFVCRKGNPFEHVKRLRDLYPAKFWFGGELQFAMQQDTRLQKLSRVSSFTARSYVTGVSILLQSDFIALLSSVHAKSDRDKLSVIPIADCDIRGSYEIVYRKHAIQSSVVKRMIALLHISADSYDWSKI